MSRIKVKTPSKYYDLIVAEGGFKKYLVTIKKNNPTSKITLITDRNIYKYYQKELAFIQEKKFYLYVVPAGEKVKNIKYKLAIENFLFQQKNNRQSILIALGGGVIGDLVGYTASTFMRGIRFYIIPTTLLSMVDSSIGGKTGINNKFGKNLIGSFYQPEGVLIDQNFLISLDQIQLKNGLAEIIKAGLIKSSSLFSYVNKYFKQILLQDREPLKQVILKSIRIKIAVVSQDEKESGYRKILNFGHTVGHGLELLSNYSILHGFAISRGMVVEAFFSKELGLLPEKDFIKIVRLLKWVGLDYELGPTLSLKQLVKVMVLDKKSEGEKIFFNLLSRIGEVANCEGQYVKEVEQGYFFQVMNKFKKLDLNSFL